MARTIKCVNGGAMVGSCPYFPAGGRTIRGTARAESRRIIYTEFTLHRTRSGARYSRGPIPARTT